MLHHLLLLLIAANKIAEIFARVTISAGFNLSFDIIMERFGQLALNLDHRVSSFWEKPRDLWPYRVALTGYIRLGRNDSANRSTSGLGHRSP
jgi:hypothetical protein